MKTATAGRGGRLAGILAQAPVIPVIRIDDPEDAVPLANALLEGGLRVLEITLRTPTALDAIERVVEAVPEAITGAGTVTRPDEYRAVMARGAQFAVSPGLTPALAGAADAARCPLLPGIATASELMQGRDAGFGYFKLFPAADIGGPGLLKALAAPFPDIRFCPTGGVDAESMGTYLRLPNVICVGGSWPLAGVPHRDWDRVRRDAADAVKRARDAGWTAGQ